MAEIPLLPHWVVLQDRIRWGEEIHKPSQEWDGGPGTVKDAGLGLSAISASCPGSAWPWSPCFLLPASLSPPTPHVHRAQSTAALYPGEVRPPSLQFFALRPRGVMSQDCSAKPCLCLLSLQPNAFHGEGNGGPESEPIHTGAGSRARNGTLAPWPPGTRTCPHLSATSQKAIARGAPLQAPGGQRLTTSLGGISRGVEDAAEPSAPKREELWVTGQLHPQAPTPAQWLLATQKPGSPRGVRTILLRQDPPLLRKGQQASLLPRISDIRPSLFSLQPSPHCRQSYGITKNHSTWR